MMGKEYLHEIEKKFGIIKFINWEGTNSSIVIALERVIHSSLARNSADEQEQLWTYIISKNGYIALFLHAKFMHLGLSQKLTEKIYSLIEEKLYYEISTDDKEDTFIERLTVSLLIGKSSTYLVDNLALLDRETRTRIIEEVKENLLFIESQKAVYILRLIEFLYENFSNEIRYFLVKNQFVFLLKDQDEKYILTFLTKLVENCSFQTAYLISKAYNFGFDRLDITETVFIESLKKCDRQEYYRGSLCYAQYKEAFKNTDTLYEWHHRVASINTEASKLCRNELRFVFVCVLLQLNADKPEEILKEYNVNITKLYEVPTKKKIVVIRNKLLKEFRKAIYLLLQKKQYTWIYNFVTTATRSNLDDYHFALNGTDQYDMKTYVGKEDFLPVIQEMVEDIADVNIVLDIYMNTFLKKVVDLSSLLELLYEKYEEGAIEAVKRYRLFGKVKEAKAIEGRRRLFYFRPLSVKANQTKSMIVHEESAKVLRLLDEEQKSRLERTTARAFNYNPQKAIVQVMVEGLGDVRLESIKEVIKLYAERKLPSDEVEKECQRIEITTVGAEISKTLIESNLYILEAAVNDLLAGRLRTSQILEKTKKISLCSYDVEDFSRIFRMNKEIHFLPYQADWIKKNFFRLIDADVSFEDMFFVYINTLLRKKNAISKFLEYTSQTKGYTYEEMVKVMPPLLGKIKRVVNKKNSEDIVLILLEPISIPKFWRKREDRFIYEVQKNGVSFTQIQKNYTRERKYVQFTIKEYCGNGEFSVGSLEVNE